MSSKAKKKIYLSRVFLNPAEKFVRLIVIVKWNLAIFTYASDEIPKITTSELCPLRKRKKNESFFLLLTEKLITDIMEIDFSRFKR